MIVLGIETSCDETAVAVVERGAEQRVRSERVKSQIPLHAKYGGIVPEIASRNHYEVIDFLTAEALQEAGCGVDDLDAIALTLGPGLLGSLLIGLSFAKGLSLSRNLPMIAVDHIQAHIEAAFIENPDIRYPVLALVVSGGHTTLFYQPSKFKTQVVAKTRDDAAGEVMDKIAKFFALGYPGGPIIDRLAGEGDETRYPFSIPRMSDGSNDFSFSGYKTAVLRHAANDRLQPGTPAFLDLVASFQHALIDYLLDKTNTALRTMKVASLIVSGGVSCNSHLRRRFREAAEAASVPLYIPHPRFCTDNAAMIAWLGYEKYQAFPHLNYFDMNLNSYARAVFREGVKHR